MGGVSYPLLSDFYPHGDVAKSYGVLRKEGMPERALFIIDKDGIVRYIDVHELREQPDEDALFEALAEINRLQDVLRRPLERRGHRLTQQSGIEQVPNGRLAHRSAAICRTRPRAEVPADCREIQTNRRSSCA